MPKMPADALALAPRRARTAATSAPVAPAAARAPRRPDRAERRLAARLQAGDADALAEIYDGCGAVTFGYLVRALGDRAAAEDVQQQVFTEVWRRGREYDPARAGLVTWVMTIARSRAIDHLRKRVPQPADPHGDALRGDAVAPPEADRLLDRWRMAGYLRRLPDGERELLRLRFYGELTQTEIADATGIPLGTVKTRMVRGLERLREMLEAEEGPAA
jgi:RNA polymerase sigma-70 factor, ECF subfamily